MQPIELTSAIYLAGTKTSIAVSSDGLLTRVHILDKSYFKQGIEHKIQDIERRRGQLSDEQMADLEGLFVKWNSFLSAPYGGVADSKTVSLRYGDKIVSGGSSIPAQVTEIEKRLMDLSRSMPVVTP